MLTTFFAPLIPVRNSDESNIEAPARVSVQHLSNGDLVIHKYNQDAVQVRLNNQKAYEFTDGLNGEPINTVGDTIKLDIAPRSRMWVSAGK